MISVKNLSKEELRKISIIAADGFKDNPGFILWGDDSERRKQVLTEFFYIAFDQLTEDEMVYATSKYYEGICAFWTKKTSLSIKQKIKLVKLVKYFSFSQMAQLAKQSSKIKRTEEFGKGKEDYLFVFMVVVQEEYRHQGYMRKMMEFIIEESKRRQVTCLLETDSKRNEAIYHHFGMETISVQEISSDLSYYILEFNP